MSLPFLNRTDRVGSQIIKITSIQLKTLENEPINFVLSGQDFKICMTYENTINETHKNVIVSFSLTDSNESPLLLLHNRLTGNTIDVKNPTGNFECIIKKLPLNEGVYLLSYSIMKDGGRSGFYDGISNVLELRVEKGDFYRTGEIAPNTFGPILLEANFINK
jgi:hypothetical protein